MGAGGEGGCLRTYHFHQLQIVLVKKPTQKFDLIDQKSRP